MPQFNLNLNPEEVIEIANCAFSECHSLTSISIPEGVKEIGNYAFFNCRSLTSAPLPSTITSIGENAFSNCKNLTSITIPKSVKEIGELAFYSCRSLTSVTLQNGLTKIGDLAFAGCRITSITIPESVKEIGDFAFKDCNDLTSIIIKEGLTKIGELAFANCRNLTSIEIPKSVEEVDCFAFENCSSLTSITIPDSVTKIGELAFKNCSKLAKIKYGDLVFEKNDEEFWTVDYNGKIFKIADNLNSTEFYSKINFIKAAHSAKTENIRFLPHNSVMKNIKADDIKSFFLNAKSYDVLLKEFAKFNHVELENLTSAREDFFKLCYVSGLFSPLAKERESAEKFIRENIIGKFNQNEFHERFSGLETSKNGYIPKFAEFLIENYSPNFLISANEPKS